MRSGENQGMTLAFSLAAARRLADPESAFSEAREWSGHVGIVSDDRPAAERFVRTHGLTQDFFTGERDRAEGLALVAEQFDAERYVFVGDGEEPRRLVEGTVWEYLPVEKAARRADWELDGEDSLLDRIMGLFSDG